MTIYDIKCTIASRNNTMDVLNVTCRHVVNIYIYINFVSENEIKPLLYRVFINPPFAFFPGTRTLQPAYERRTRSRRENATTKRFENEMPTGIR